MQGMRAMGVFFFFNFIFYCWLTQCTVHFCLLKDPPMLILLYLWWEWNCDEVDIAFIHNLDGSFLLSVLSHKANQDTSP